MTDYIAPVRNSRTTVLILKGAFIQQVTRPQTAQHNYLPLLTVLTTKLIIGEGLAALWKNSNQIIKPCTQAFQLVEE